MKSIFKQLQYLILLLIGYYSIFLFGSIVFYPTPNFIDTQESSNCIFGTEPKYVVLGRDILRHDADRIFLLGSSNVREGFRPLQITPNLPGYEIHNLAVGASNLSQVRQVVQLIYEVLPESSKPKSVFVLGIWYGLFVDDQTRWKGGDTDIDVERKRFHLYAKDGGQIRADVPAEYLNYLTFLTRPFLFIDNILNMHLIKLLTGMKDNIAEKLKGTKNYQEINDKDSISLNDTYKEVALKFWQKYMGVDRRELQNEQFIVLLSLVKLIEKNQGKVIIVDLPLPKWHTEKSPYYQDYQKRKREFLKDVLRLKDVSYLNFQDMNNDLDYYDSAHPKPKVTMNWSSCLGKRLSDILWCTTWAIIPEKPGN